MSSQTFKNDYASAVLTIWGDGNATLSNVFSRNRGKGYAKELVAEICRYADHEGLRISLLVQQYGKPSEDKLDNIGLRAFYEKFDFVKVAGQRGVVAMCREPSQDEQSL